MYITNVMLRYLWAVILYSYYIMGIWDHNMVKYFRPLHQTAGLLDPSVQSSRSFGPVVWALSSESL